MSTTDVYATGFDEASGKTIEADCPECPGQVVADGGERRCAECGLIVDEYHIEHGHGGYRFGDGREERTGAPLTQTRHDRGLSTEIGHGVDGKGNPLSGSKRQRMWRLRREHSRARWRSMGERNLGIAFSEIARTTSALELPRSVREEASGLYRRAQTAGLITGRSIEAMAAGSVYAACRCRGCVRTVEEVAAVSRCSAATVRRGYQVLNIELGLHVRPPRPRDFVARFASASHVTDEVRSRAQRLTIVADEEGLTNGRNPAGVAAACLYVAARASGDRLTQKALADMANVTPATLRNRYRELAEIIG